MVEGDLTVGSYSPILFSSLGSASEWFLEKDGGKLIRDSYSEE